MRTPLADYYEIVTCPFCGRTPVVRRTWLSCVVGRRRSLLRLKIACRKCRFEMPWRRVKDARKVWNRGLITGGCP